MSIKTFIGLVLLSASLAGSARALIEVGGKDPVTDRNWPAGSLDVANQKSRQSWYEGPPFGGGQSVFQYRGDTNVFNDVLAKFAQIKAPDLLLVVHEGPSENPVATREDKAKGSQRVDWSFTVWTPENFYRLFGNSSGFYGSDQPEFHTELPAPRLDVYVSDAGVDWNRVQVPPGLRVLDERAISHGYKPEDGSVISGVAYDMMTSKPVAAVEVVIAKYEKKPAKPAPAVGGDADAKVELNKQDEMRWNEVASTVGDADGRFELTKIPAGSYQVLLRCVGYAPRALGYFSCTAGAFKSYVVRLSPAVEQKGRVLDLKGKPLAKVKVRVDTTIAIDGRGYPCGRINELQEVLTDADGRFTLTGLPRGQAMITLWADNLYQLNMIKMYEIPTAKLTLTMTGTGVIRGKVSAANGTLRDGNVSVWPEGGNRVGTWGGGMNVKEDGSFQFDNVPPGKYLISADPAAQFDKRKKATAIEVKAGETVEVELTK